MSAAEIRDWEKRLGELIPLLGHRNWIVVADSAYPAQSNPGIETIVTDASQIEVARFVAEAIAASSHVRAKVYVDTELEFVTEQDAPGVNAYRTNLMAALKNASLQTIPHDQVITKLDEAAQVFRVLILKTSLTIPYTSIFFELDCGYWSAEAEQRLRKSMAVAREHA